MPTGYTADVADVLIIYFTEYASNVLAISGMYHAWR